MTRTSFYWQYYISQETKDLFDSKNLTSVIINQKISKHKQKTSNETKTKKKLKTKAIQK